MTVVPARHGLGVCFGCGCDRDLSTVGCNACQSRRSARRKPAPRTRGSVNQQVRTAAGVDGEPVIMGAWCLECRCEVLPSLSGKCGWCDRQILNLATLELGEDAA